MRIVSLALFAVVATLATLATSAAAAPYYSWSTSSSADAFETSMENPTDGILLDNWPLEHWTVKVHDADKFRDIVGTRSYLRNVVANRVRDICLGRGNATTTCAAARTYLRGAWVEEDGAGFVAAYRLATVFIAVDQDNWFGFDNVADKIMNYLSTGRRELRLYKGFNPVGVIAAGGIPLADLVVVIDHDEQTLTFWSATLFD